MAQLKTLVPLLLLLAVLADGWFVLRIRSRRRSRTRTTVAPLANGCPNIPRVSIALNTGRKPSLWYTYAEQGFPTDRLCKHKFDYFLNTTLIQFFDQFIQNSTGGKVQGSGIATAGGDGQFSVTTNEIPIPISFDTIAADPRGRKYGIFLHCSSQGSGTQAVRTQLIAVFTSARLPTKSVRKAIRQKLRRFRNLFGLNTAGLIRINQSDEICPMPTEPCVVKNTTTGLFERRPDRVCRLRAILGSRSRSP